MLQTINVSNMVSGRGNKVPNQFIVVAKGVSYFQSYESVIAALEDGGAVTLDATYWDYSRTTSKYLGQFLGEPMAEVRKKVKDGTYTLEDLNL